ncbi:hypothetical protein SLS64_004113 [Diaporthe eres]|uniref:Uncharacterized protein n=1 Tax=Diaporthe eres TaxID=83184 RepID=A0ABR1PQQ6_DIAER
MNNQEDDAVYKANPGDKVTYNYKYNPSTGKTDQIVSVYGNVVSTLNILALNGASGNLVTADGGETWTVADITVNQCTCS